jgi:hypothetical protein
MYVLFAVETNIKKGGSIMKEMGIKVALGILGPKGDSKEDLLTARNAALLKWHPDHAGQTSKTLDMTRKILDAFHVLLKRLGEWSISWGPDAKDSTGNKHIFAEVAAIHDKVAHIPGLNRSLVGVWYWVRGETEFVETELKAAGLRKKKNTTEWYYAPAWSFSKKRSWKNRSHWDHAKRVATFGKTEMEEKQYGTLG